MLDNLLDGLKDNFVGAIADKAGLGMEQAEQAFPIAKESITSGLMEQVTGGNIGNILGMFNSGGSMTSNSLFGNIKQQFMKGIMTKLGVPESIAGLAAGAGLENLLGGLGNSLKGDDGEVSESSLMDKLGLGGGLGDIAKNIAGDALKDKLGGIGNLFG